tara:strand:- start:2825 stop:3007 length:183 start_codon:yes stop_codon:yes gene_type:complete
MNKVDARTRVYNEMLASAERKWEFRYENQKKTIGELEQTIKDLRVKIKELKARVKDEDIG